MYGFSLLEAVDAAAAACCDGDEKLVSILLSSKSMLYNESTSYENT